MNEVTTTTQQRPEIVKFGEQLESRASQLKMALPAHITPEKFQRTVITAAQSDPELLKADRQSLVLACMKAAQDGLLPDKREAAIVVFKENKKTDSGWQTRLIATYMPMVYGLRKKILQSGEVVALEVSVVYKAEVEAGKFLYEVGIEPPLRHRPMLELTADETTDDQIVAAYSIATMKDGTKSYELMRRFEIDRVRETSKTGATKDRQGKARTPSGPWVDWYPEMAKKTVMRRHAKTLPMSGDIIVDLEGQEQDAGKSAAALLSQQPDAPQLTDERPDDDETPHDTETGEILDDGNQGGDDDGQAGEEAQPDKPKRTRRTKEQIAADNAAAAEASAEGNADASQATSEAGDASNNSESSQTSSTSTTAQTSASPSDTRERAERFPDDDEQPTDEMGVAAHPAEAKAQELIGAMDQAATIIDVDRIYNEAEDDRAAMPDEIAAECSAAWQRNRKRTRGGN